MGSELKWTSTTAIWDGSGGGGTGGSVRGSFDTGARHKELSGLLWSNCPIFWPTRLRLSTAGKRQTVNYFVHITHVPQLRQEHLVTVPEITVPQWHTRKVRQMGGQRRKSRAASHPLLSFFLSMIARHNEKWSSITCHRDVALLLWCICTS